MKKKLLSALLVAAMAVTLLPDAEAAPQKHLQLTQQQKQQTQQQKQQTQQMLQQQTQQMLQQQTQQKQLVEMWLTSTSTEQATTWHSLTAQK